MGAFESIKENVAVESLSEVDIEQIIYDSVQAKAQIDRSQLLNAVKDRKLPIHVINPMTSVNTFFVDLFEKPDSASLGEFNRRSAQSKLK